MRYKIIVVLLILFIETFGEGVQGPPTNEKKKKDDDAKTEEYISHVRGDDEELSALKIVSAPDLSKERDRRKDTKDDDSIVESADITMLKQAKWLQKMVQEIGGFQYTIVSNDQEIAGTIEDEGAPPELEPLPPKELTEEERHGKQRQPSP